MEFLNRQKLKYDWKKDKLEYSKGIVVDEKPKDNAAANVPGIELESGNVGATGISTIAELSFKQEVHKGAEITGLTSSSKVAEESVDNALVVDLMQEDEEDATEKILSLQECKLENIETYETAGNNIPTGW